VSRQRLLAAVGAGAAALLLAAVPVFEGTLFNTYRDPIGILTACTGHTGPELRLGQIFTHEQCEQMLVDDLAQHAAKVQACVRTPLTQGQRAAFVSFAFNVGGQAFCASTLARKANAGDMAAACAELSRWVLAGSKPLPGLVKRRAIERAWCEGRAPTWGEQ
jgi:lysozyme